MSVQRRQFLALMGSSTAIGLAGCTAFGSDDSAGPEIRGERLTVTTTTSTYDTGLLDELNAAFESRYGVTVDTVSQGTGAAIETGRNGDTDVVIVHARDHEDAFLESGYAINRRDLMVNDFVVLGEPDDPAGIAGGDDAAEALAAIAESASTFVSRGDRSGTHTKELELWAEAGVGDDEFGEWYRDIGQGMGEVLVQTGQTGGYTLSDRGSYLSMRTEIELDVQIEGPIGGGPEQLSNPYGVVAINPAVHDSVNYDLAMAYIGFLTSTDGQERIEAYTVDGEQLFFPDALTDDPTFEQYVPEAWNGSNSDD